MTAQSQIVNNPSRLRAHSLGNDAPELAQYQDEPAQMHSGAGLCTMVQLQRTQNPGHQDHLWPLGGT